MQLLGLVGLTVNSPTFADKHAEKLLLFADLYAERRGIFYRDVRQITLPGH